MHRISAFIAASALWDATASGTLAQQAQSKSGHAAGNPFGSRLTYLGSSVCIAASLGRVAARANVRDTRTK